MLIVLRVFICSPLVAKAFAAQSFDDPFKQEEDLEATYQYIVVSLTELLLFQGNVADLATHLYQDCLTRKQICLMTWQQLRQIPLLS